MNFITKLFSGGADKLVDSVSKGLDNLFTSDEERLQAKNILQAEMNNFQIELETKANEYEKEITKRWTSDNEHVITRLIRPLSYIFILILFGVMVMFDGNAGQITIKTAYIPVIETLLITMTVAYFGSRGAEKITNKIKEK